MGNRFLKSKKLQGTAAGILAAIVLLLVFLVIPIVASESPTALISEGVGTVGGGFGTHLVGAYGSPPSP